MKKKSNQCEHLQNSIALLHTDTSNKTTPSMQLFSNILTNIHTLQTVLC